MLGVPVRCTSHRLRATGQLAHHQSGGSSRCTCDSQRYLGIYLIQGFDFYEREHASATDVGEYPSHVLAALLLRSQLRLSTPTQSADSSGYPLQIQDGMPMNGSS